MFSKTAAIYNEVYSFKNYVKESAQITERILKEHPTAKSVLDVACGTAEHAKYLSARFDVDGIDLEPDFVEIAKDKNPNSRFWQADMTDFSLGKAYDVVQCLFSSIGYLKSSEKVIAALKCFARHLNPGGVILVEPWFTPNQWKEGVPHMVTVDKPDLKICRMNVSERVDNLSILKFNYLVARKSGVEHFSENHELALYTVEEMLSYFKETALVATYDTEGIMGRGLYTARRK